MSDKRRKKDKKKKPDDLESTRSDLAPEASQPEDLESTQTELSPEVLPPEGPPLEVRLPEPPEESKQPLEIGPSHEVDPSDETHTDVLRVEEPNAADTDEPVSQPPAAPDPAPGTQPSLFYDDTRTDVFRPDQQTQELREQVMDEREAEIETGTDIAPAKPGEPEDGAWPDAGDETRTDVWRLDAPIQGETEAEPEPFSIHDQDTADLEDVPPEVGPKDDETRTDLSPLSTPPVHPEAQPLPETIEVDEPKDARVEPAADSPEPVADFGLEPAPEPEARVEVATTERGAAPKPRRQVRGRRKPKRPRKVKAKPRRTGPPLRTRLKAFFAPRSFLAGVRKDLKSFLDAWIRSGKRASSDLKVEKTAEWWRRTMLEIAALFAIVVPIEMVVNSGRLGSFGTHPHPYWLIVLPMAGARGVVAGMLAAAAAALLHSVGAYQALGHINLFTFEIMMEPILFFGVGYFAGELHDELALRHRKIARQFEEVQERNQRLRQERDVLADANKLLERRIVDHSVQFGNLVVAATRIENAGRSEVFEIALDLVEEHCGAVSSVLLLLGDGTIDYLSHAWPEEELASRLAVARQSDFVKRAVSEGIGINGFSPDEETPESGPLAVAPLFDDNGLVKALLCLDDIPASRLNESTITIFFGITEWLNSALVRLAKTESQSQTRSAPRAGPMGEVWLGEPEELGERLRLELERCARYGVPTSFLAIQAPEWKDTSREGIEAIDRFICIHFTGGLRPSDTIYKFGYPGCYLLVLAGTTVEGAEVVRTRLMRRVEYTPSQQVGPIQIFATGPDVEAPDLVSLVERVAGRFRDASPLALDGTCPVRVPDQRHQGNVDGFIRHLRMETSLATRNKFAMNVIGISSEVMHMEDPDLLTRHVRDAGAQTLRPTDGVFGLTPNQCAILLPCTGDEEAASVAHRLVQAIRARDPDAPYGNLETKVLSLGENHVDVTSFLQALARQGDES